MCFQDRSSACRSYFKASMPWASAPGLVKLCRAPAYTTMCQSRFAASNACRNLRTCSSLRNGSALPWAMRIFALALWAWTGRQRQCAVKAHHALHVGAAVGQLKHRGPTEAVADRRNALRIDHSLIPQHGQSFKGSSLPLLHVSLDLLHPGSCLVRMGGDLAFSIHVHGKGHVPESRELPGPVAGIFIQSPPFVHHQDTRSFPRSGIIPCQKPFEWYVAVLIGNRLGLNLGKTQGGDKQNQHEHSKSVYHRRSFHHGSRICKRARHNASRVVSWTLYRKTGFLTMDSFVRDTSGRDRLRVARRLSSSPRPSPSPQPSPRWRERKQRPWIPAFAGMTDGGEGRFSAVTRGQVLRKGPGRGRRIRFSGWRFGRDPLC